MDTFYKMDGPAAFVLAVLILVVGLVVIVRMTWRGWERHDEHRERMETQKYAMIAYKKTEGEKE